jgi:hypothetical protein
MTGFVLALRWRTSPAMARDAWKRDSAQFAPTDTVGDVRARLAAARGSTADLAADFDPELWLCDDEGRPATQQATRPSTILRWTCTTCPSALRDSQENGEPVAVFVFTFPLAATVAPFAAPAVSVRARRTPFLLTTPCSWSFFRLHAVVLERRNNARRARRRLDALSASPVPGLCGSRATPRGSCPAP